MSMLAEGTYDSKRSDKLAVGYCVAVIGIVTVTNPEVMVEEVVTGKRLELGSSTLVV